MFFDDDEIDGYGEENRLVQSTKGEYDIEENVLRPKTLEAYVGQLDNNRVTPFFTSRLITLSNHSDLP